MFYRLIIATLALFILSGCIPIPSVLGGDKTSKEEGSKSFENSRSEGAQKMQLDATWPVGNIQVDYPSDWNFSYSDESVVFLPEDPEGKIVRIDFGMSYGGCLHEGGFDRELERIVQCELESLQHYHPSEPVVEKSGNSVFVWFHSTENNEYVGSEFTQVIFVLPLAGREYTSAAVIEGTPGGYEKYSRYFEAMVERVRTIDE